MTCFNYIQSQIWDKFSFCFDNDKTRLLLFWSAIFSFLRTIHIELMLPFLPSFNFSKIWNCKVQNPLKVGLDSSFINQIFLTLWLLFLFLTALECFPLNEKQNKHTYLPGKALALLNFCVFVWEVAHQAGLMLSSPTLKIQGSLPLFGGRTSKDPRPFAGIDQ